MRGDDGDGPVVDWWLYEDAAKPIPKVVACAGMPFEEHTIDAIAYADMRPGCYDRDATDRRKQILTREHLNVLRGRLAWQASQG